MSPRRVSVGVAVLVVLILAFFGAWLQQGSTASAQGQSNQVWSYAAKFVCGLQRDPGPNFPGEPVVKPGNYATEINIHNPHYITNQAGNVLTIRKKVLMMVRHGEIVGREPETVGPTPFVSLTLKPDYATMDDCNQIWKMAGITPSAPGLITIGYLVILSPLELDVDAVYTAEVFKPATAGAAAEPTGIALDVERVNGKRINIGGPVDKVSDSSLP